MGIPTNNAVLLWHAKLPSSANIGRQLFFFTVVTYRRQPLLIHTESRRILRCMIREVRKRFPFTIDAWVLLPEHLHCIWTLPPGDHDFPTRWGIIKAGFSKEARDLFRHAPWLNTSKTKHRESTIWQRRFWEHQVRDHSSIQTNEKVFEWRKDV